MNKNMTYINVESYVFDTPWMMCLYSFVVIIFTKHLNVPIIITWKSLLRFVEFAHLIKLYTNKENR